MSDPRSGPSVLRLDPRLDALVPPNAEVERLAGGFAWSEGPVWRARERCLLFSDIPNNTVYRWSEDDGLRVHLRPAGLAEGEPFGRELGSNALTLDPHGALVMCDHGNRRIARVDESRFTKTVLAERYEGRRLNSPNDLVYRSNGDLYFTDPPYGLDGRNDHPAKELPFNGVYRLAPDGTVTLLVRDLTFPNGLAFSPDERTLYVAVSDPERAVWMAYDVTADGTLASGRVLVDATPHVRAGKAGLPDGMKVDERGHLFATGPGGLFVIAPDGTHLGTIAPGRLTANCAWGDDGATLYITANDELLRVRLTTRGRLL